MATTNWQTKKIGEIIVENKKSAFRSKGNINGVYPFFVSGFNIKNINKYLVENESIYLPTGGNFFVHYYNGKASYSTDTWSIRTNDDVNIRYLYYFLIFNQEYIGKKLFKGATIKHLQKNDFKNIEIPFPSLLKQKLIVKTLDETLNKIKKVKENFENNLQNAEELLKSYLQDVFMDSSLTRRKLGEIAEHSLGKMLDKVKNKGELKPYLRNFNVRWFSFDLSDIQKMKFEEKEMDRYMAVKGDVLICEGGYPGRAAIWMSEDPIYFQKAIHRVRFKSLEESKWFLYYLYFSHITGRLNKYFTGTGILHFTGTALDSFIIPTAPAPKQKAIVKKLDDISKQTKKLEVIYKKKLVDLEELKKSVLKKAFTGKL